VTNDLSPRGQRTIIAASPLAAREAALGAPPTTPHDAEPPAWRQPARAPTALHDDVPPLPQAMRVRNPLMAASARFLALCAAVAADREVADPEALLARAIVEVRAFEKSAREAGLSPEDANRGKYGLAATMDDIVQNLPGGPPGDWARRSVTVQAFGQAFGGDQFWTILDAMLAKPNAYQELLELYHACLAVGFQGRFRASPDEGTQLTARRAAVYATLSAIKGGPENDIVPQWRGVPTSTRRLGRWMPILFGAGALLALLLLLFVGLKFWLDARDQPALAALRQIPPPAKARLARDVNVSVADSVQLQRVRARIASPCIAARDDGADIRLTIAECAGLGPGMFDKGASDLRAAYAPVVVEAMKALLPEGGPIKIVAHTDSDPIRGAAALRFPDNAALSAARAQGVFDRLSAVPGASGRMTAEGAGDREPVDRADTVQAKARNRRVELVIARSGA
jgi:type VI secretion system protein ImpK